MAKLLTNTGKEFIRTVCSGSSNTLLKGKYKYNLPFSDLYGTETEFEAFPKNNNGNAITTNEDLAEELIVLFDKYAALVDIDANILAAQAYVESGYRAWHYSKYNSGSGIVNLTGIKAYTHIVNSQVPLTLEGLKNLKFTDEEINKITTGLTNPDKEVSYLYRGPKVSDTTKAIARTNRVILHQNIIDNIELQIKFQASIMKEILDRNNYIIANALLAYKTYWLLSSTTYNGALDFLSRDIDETILRRGIKYINDVYTCLGDKNNVNITGKAIKPAGIWFGYDLDFTSDEFNAFLA